MWRSVSPVLLLLAAAPAPGWAQSYLVAPFTNRTQVAQFDWLGESLAESVREMLVEESVPAVSRDERDEAARKLSLKSISQVSLAALIKLCESANAERLLYGRMEFVPAPPPPASPPSAAAAASTEPATGSAPPATPASRGTLRVTARVFDVKDAVQVIEFFETGPVEKLGELETDLAWKIRRWLRPDRPVPLEDFRLRHPVVKITARESYVRGLLASSAEQRHRLFTQAVRQEPLFAQPVFQLGREHFVNANYREAAGWLERIPGRSVHFVESRFLLALSRYQLSDYAAARQIFEQIHQQLPTPELWNNLGAAEARLNLPRALDSFRKALEADPNDPDYQFNVGYTLWKRGEFETAANHFRAVLDRTRDDQDAIQLLGRCLKKSGPRAGDWRSEGLERLKESYEEPASR